MDIKSTPFIYCKAHRPGRNLEKLRKYFRIFLNDRMDRNEKSIYFIQAYSEFPVEINSKKGFLLAFNFDFLHANTEHKDILFNLPFLLHEFHFYKISLKKSSFEYLDNLSTLMLQEFTRRNALIYKIAVSYINIFFLHCETLLKPDVITKVKHHYTSLLIVSRFRQLIYMHAAKQRNVSFYADQLNLTPNYLNIVLKAVTAKNASAHIFEFIMNEAKYLLIHTKLSLKEVASELGFSDQSYFTRFFKKQSGKNPLDWFNQTI